MAEPKKIRQPDPAFGKDDAAKSASAPDTRSELPHVDSPSISPAEDAPTAEPVDKPAVTQALTIIQTRAGSASASTSHFTLPQFTISRRLKRRAMTAASLALTAAFGAIIGVMASQGFATPEVTRADTAEETQAMRKSIAYLSKEFTTLKAGIDGAAKSATMQIGKVTDRIDKLERAETTGSITKTAVVETPLPPIRPQIVQTSIVQGWTARALRNGVILVEGRGEIYQVSPGVPLPGLGSVESIRREGDRWVVATPKGIIVSSNAMPPRPHQYYPPPYFRPF
jgi:hypothetical protein